MKNQSAKWVLGHHITPHHTTGDYDLVIGTTPPQMMGPPPHFHQELNEVFIVTEGQMEFVVDGETKTLRKGDSINLSPNSVHTFRNATDQECKWVNIHSPKGFLKFFENLGVHEHQDNAQEKSLGKDKIQEVITTAAEYDMIIPPPPQ